MLPLLGIRVAGVDPDAGAVNPKPGAASALREKRIRVSVNQGMACSY